MTLDVKKEEDNKTGLYSDSDFLKEKVFYLILIIFTIIISSKIPTVFRSNNYVIGDIVKSDIYSPKTVIYKDNDEKNRIIQNMIDGLKKEYIYSREAAELSLKELTEFSKEIEAVKDKNLDSFNYSNFESDTGKKIPAILVENLLNLKANELKETFASTKTLLTNIYHSGVYKEREVIRIDEPYKTELENLPGIKKELISYFITPNYIYDEIKTKESIEEKISQIKDQYIEIKAGTLIARTGEILTQRKINILSKVGEYTYKTSIFNLFLTALYLLVISTIVYNVIVTFYKDEILNKNKYKALMLLITVLFLILRFVPINHVYMLPLETGLFLMLFITRHRFSIFMYNAILAFMLPIIDFDLVFFAINVLAMVASGFMAKKITTRSAIIALGIQIVVLKMLLYFVFSFFSMVETYGMALNLVKIFSSGLVSGMFAIALLPYFERTFNILTIFRLIELGDLSHPLLRKLSIDAPGTFQHSMMVAVLSENAVIQIGGDPVFTRVACYYHDIGKSKRPQFFVENQSDGENPHNNLSVFMSKMVILSHTKDGIEMAKKYKIPKEIRDIMHEHHGTTLLAYFYNKAKQENPEITEEEFRYTGQKPQTKESAVIMLADSIEAAVRSLQMKNPVTIEEMVRKIVNTKIADHQLSDANITFKEVEIIIASFVKTFSSIYHERIKYPGQKN
ncbi:HD family phosphohydrolase [Fusobacterium varium]|uniref:HD family phosphohydrolase n=1 Tax=Fusobacterium varium TaxID=856 RepID=UPI00242B3874|nr:HDIG domain-containing metalloprotein [Fusobacterium varium]MCI6034179.1 HDIG domain-containing protein [Fusobacterium varium]